MRWTHSITWVYVIYIYLFAEAPIRKSWNKSGHLLFRKHKRIGKKYVLPIRTLPSLEPSIDKGSPSPLTTRQHSPKPGTVDNKIWTDAPAHFLVKQRLSLEDVGALWSLKLSISPFAVLAFGFAVFKQVLVRSIELNERIGDILVIFFRRVTRRGSGPGFIFYRCGGLLSGGAGRRNCKDCLIIALLNLYAVVLFCPLFRSRRRGRATTLAGGSRLWFDGSRIWLDGGRARLAAWPGDAFRFTAQCSHPTLNTWSGDVVSWTDQVSDYPSFRRKATARAPCALNDYGCSHILAREPWRLTKGFGNSIVVNLNILDGNYGQEQFSIQFRGPSHGWLAFRHLSLGSTLKLGWIWNVP